MNPKLFNELLKEGESNTLDFKESGYFSALSLSKKDKDAEFIKDILSFTNTVRQETSYIIIGIKNDGLKIGITDEEFEDNAVLQAKIKDKVIPIPKFTSYPFFEDGLRYQIIEIPVSWYSRPCVPTLTIGGTLERNQIYIRRDSSNEKASYDEMIKLKSWLDSLPKLAELNSQAAQKAKQINKGFQFDELTIQRLFGNEAAEDEDVERLKQYYFKNDIFDKIAVDLPLRILVGHKGIGKSALFNISISEDKENGKLPLKIRPDDIANIAKDETDFSNFIRNWRQGLLSIILKKAFSSFGIRKQINIDFENIEGDYINFITDNLEQALDEGIIAEQNIEVLKSFLKNPIINVYIDDLDRGWEGSKYDITKISALLNAVRDIVNTEKRRLQFKISLRSDVYFLYRTSDESTDKTQSSVIWYRWNLNEILGLLVKRVRTFFNKEIDEIMLRSLQQSDLAKDLNTIIEPLFSGQGKWENKEMYKVLLSVIRKRPRDLVKLLTLAGRNANNRSSSLIITQDLKTVFDEYSLDRIQDTINEYKSELPMIERLIFGMKPDKKAFKASDSFYYTTQALMLKINKIIDRGDFRFTNGKVANAKELAAFLYKINFITATKVLDDGFIERKDFEENRYLVPKFEDFGYDWEVHMAFRWGLQPSNQEDIYSNL